MLAYIYYNSSIELYIGDVNNDVETSDTFARSEFGDVIKLKDPDTSNPSSPISSTCSIEDEALAAILPNNTPKTPSNAYMSAFPTPPSGGSLSTIPNYSNDSPPIGKS